MSEDTEVEEKNSTAVLEADESQEAEEKPLKKKTKKYKNTHKLHDGAHKSMKRYINALNAGLDRYEELRQKSGAKKKDGEVKDSLKNYSKALNKITKKSKKAHKPMEKAMKNIKPAKKVRKKLKKAMNKALVVKF